ncbi:MAG: NimC/NimA family protein, partial [Firmicutes bacterium]|nr:NimC/NimA family protein [Bacillota bacterium]
CCFGEGKWIRIQADLIWDDRPETIKFLLDQNPNLRRMYSEGDGNCLGLRYENAVATIYSFTEEPRVIKF